MKNPSPSHLFLLMECFHTRIKDLAESLHISDSLISKWRNNKRFINPKSVYADLICQYYLKIDQKNNFKTIKTLLSDDYKQIEEINEEVLLSLFKNWLLESPDQLDDSKMTLDVNSYTTQITVYHFDSGREKAVLRMLETLKSLPQSQELLIFDCEENSWRKEDSRFLEKRRKLSHEVTQKHRMKIIHTLNAKYVALKNLFQRDINLNLNYNVDTYYIPLQFVPNFLSDMLIIKDKAALICQFNDNFTVQHYAEYHTDIRTVQYYQQFYDNLKLKSNPMYVKHHFENNKEIHTFFKSKLCIKGHLYFIASLPFPFNDVDDPVTHNSTVTDEPMRFWEAALTQGKVRHIYNIKKIENFIKTLHKNKTSEAVFLSKIFLQQIEYLIHLIEKHPNFEMAFFSDPPSTEDENIAFLIKDNSYSIAYKYEVETQNYNVLTSENPTEVYTLYQHYDRFWDNIYTIQQNNDLILYKLRKILSFSEN